MLRSSAYWLNLSIFTSGFIRSMIAFVAIAAASVFVATNYVEAVFEVLKSVMYLIFILSLIMTFSGEVKLKTQELLDKVFKTLAIGALFISTMALYQYYQYLKTEMSIPEFLPEVRSTLGNKNLVASILLILLPPVIFLVVKCKGFWSFFSLGIANVVLVTIVLLQSRAVWIGLFGCLLLTISMLFFYYRRPITRLKAVDKKSLLYGILLITIITATSYQLFFDRTLVGALTVRAEELIQAKDDNAAKAAKRMEPGAIYARRIMWGKSMNMAIDHPILGVGAGNWKIILPTYGLGDLGKLSNTGLRHYQRPHNDFLWVLAENGPLGLLFYLLVFFYVLKYCHKLLKEPNTNEKAIAFTIAVSVVAYLFISLLTFPKERIYHNVIIYLLAALMFLVYNNRFGQNKVSVSASRLPLIFGLAISVFSLYVGITRVKSESIAKKALKAHSMQNWPRLKQLSNAAISDWYNMDPTAAPLKWYSGVASFSMNDLEAAFEDFEEASKVHPNHIHVLNNLGSCYELKEDHEQALKYYQLALDISPGFEEALINQSAVYFNLGEVEKAYASISKCSSSTGNATVDRFLFTISARIVEDMRSQTEDTGLANILSEIATNEQQIQSLQSHSDKTMKHFKELIAQEAIQTYQLKFKATNQQLVSLKKGLLK